MGRVQEENSRVTPEDDGRQKEEHGEGAQGAGGARGHAEGPRKGKTFISLLNIILETYYFPFDYGGYFRSESDFFIFLFFFIWEFSLLHSFF